MKKYYSRNSNPAINFCKALILTLASFLISSTTVLGMEDIYASKSQPRGICLFGWQIKKGLESPNKRLQTTEGELEFEGNPAPLHHTIVDTKIYRAKKIILAKVGEFLSGEILRAIK